MFQWISISKSHNDYTNVPIVYKKYILQPRQRLILNQGLFPYHPYVLLLHCCRRSICVVSVLSVPTISVIRCPQLPSIANGNIHCSGSVGRVYGSTCTHRCNSGYSLTGAGTLTCQRSGAYTPNRPTCQSMSSQELVIYKAYFHMICNVPGNCRTCYSACMLLCELVIYFKLATCQCMPL